MSRRQILYLANNVLIVVTDEVISTVKFNHLIRGLLCAMNIQESILRTMLDDHFTVSIEGIGSASYRITVRPSQAIGIADIIRFGSCSKSNAGETATDTEVVVVAIYILQAKLGNAILTIVKIAIDPIQAVLGMCVSVGCAIFTKVIPYRIGIGVILDKADTCIHISIGTEIVILTVDLNHRTSVVAGAIAISGTGSVHCPRTGGNTIVAKGIRNAANRLFAHVELVVRTCVAIFAVIGILPTLLEDIIDGVVEVAVHLKDAGTGLVHVAAAVISTNEPVVNDHIVVTKLFEDGAPINHRLTGLAVSSVLVTFRRYGGSLIEDGQFLIVVMPRIIVDVQIGCLAQAIAEETGRLIGEHNHTLDNFALNGNNRAVSGLELIFRGNGRVGHVVDTIPRPDTDRDADDSTGFSLNAADSLDLNSQKAADFIVIKGSLEALGNGCSDDLPGVGILKLQNSRQLGNCGHFCCIDVNVVDRIILGKSAGIVAAADGNRSFACNCKGSSDTDGVTQLVLDLKGNNVFTGQQSSILLRGQNATGNGRRNLNTINKDLTGGQIQRGIIGNVSRESDLIAVDSCTVFQSDSGVGGGIGDIGNGRQNSIIHSGAVVQSKVVKVEGVISGNSGLDVVTHEAGFSALRTHGIHQRYVIITGQISTAVNPTRLGDLLFLQSIQILVGTVSHGNLEVHLSQTQIRGCVFAHIGR